jgi:hypothetical protein
VESESLLFKTVFLWVAASDYSISNYHVFLDLFSGFSYGSLIYSMCNWLTPSPFLMNL